MEKNVCHCCLTSHFIAAVAVLGQCFRLSRSIVTESGEPVICEGMTCVSHSRKGRGEDQGTSSFCFQDGTVLAYPRRIAWSKHIPQRPISQPFTEDYTSWWSVCWAPSFHCKRALLIAFGESLSGTSFACLHVCSASPTCRLRWSYWLEDIFNYVGKEPLS